MENSKNTTSTLGSYLKNIRNYEECNEDSDRKFLEKAKKIEKLQKKFKILLQNNSKWRKIAQEKRPEYLIRFDDFYDIELLIFDTTFDPTPVIAITIAKEN